MRYSDADLRFQRINERLAEMNGLPADQHLGRTSGEVLPNLAPFIEPVYRQVLETGKPVIDLEIHGGAPAAARSGTRIPGKLLSTKSVRHRYAGINVVVQDITDRKRAEAALAESEDRFRSMADSAPVIIWLSDGVGTIFFVNKQALLFTGRTEEELYERKWLELIIGKIWAARRPWHPQLWTAGAPVNSNFDCVVPTGATAGCSQLPYRD